MAAYMVSGAKGSHAGAINGLYTLSDEQQNGCSLYMKEPIQLPAAPGAAYAAGSIHTTAASTGTDGAAAAVDQSDSIMWLRKEADTRTWMVSANSQKERNINQGSY